MEPAAWALEVSCRLSVPGGGQDIVNLLHLFVQTRRGVAARARNLWYRALGVHLDGYVWLRQVSIPRQWSDITLEAGAALDDGVTLLCSGPAKANKLVIRRGAYLNRNTMVDAHGSVEIGRDCMIGPGCYITDADHGMDPDLPVSSQPMTIEPVVLEDGVWLGAGVVVLSGVHIGRGAVVGAGAVVTRDVAAKSAVGGVPARAISLGPPSLARLSSGV
jgi:carbonic anhydrase/acetyltransferase-like protein (isoleucine patch superfamily)